MKGCFPERLPEEQPFVQANEDLLDRTATFAWECCLRVQKPVGKQEPAVLKTVIAPGSEEELKGAVQLGAQSAQGGFYAEYTHGSIGNSAGSAVRGNGDGPGYRGRCWSRPRAGGCSHGLWSPGLRLGLLRLLPLRLRSLRLLRAGLVLRRHFPRRRAVVRLGLGSRLGWPWLGWPWLGRPRRLRRLWRS